MRPDRGDLLFSVPSKTFLIGEYAILNGGPALVLGHEPRFELQVRFDGSGSSGGIHPQSPAGQWMRAHASAFQKVSLEFHDPHQGRGGFGASSGQFALCYALARTSTDGSVRPTSIDVESMWRDFRELNHGAGLLPSGADVVAQTLGGASVVRTTPFEAQSGPWPFANLSVLLFATGNKVATHEHLRELLPVSDQVLELSEQGVRAFLVGDEALFLASVRSFAEELERLQLVTAATRGLIAEMSALSSVLAVKGCGALGADVVAVFTRPGTEREVVTEVQSRGLRYVASSRELSAGLKLEVSLAPYQSTSEAPAWV